MEGGEATEAIEVGERNGDEGLEEDEAALDAQEAELAGAVFDEFAAQDCLEAGTGAESHSELLEIGEGTMEHDGAAGTGAGEGGFDALLREGEGRVAPRGMGKFGEGGGAADFAKGGGEGEALAGQGGLAPEGEEGLFLGRGGADFGEGVDGVAADFFGGVGEKAGEPLAGLRAAVVAGAFAEDDCDGADEGDLLEAPRGVEAVEILDLGPEIIRGKRAEALILLLVVLTAHGGRLAAGGRATKEKGRVFFLAFGEAVGLWLGMRTRFVFMLAASLLTAGRGFAAEVSIIAEGAKPEVLGDGYQFTEGPAVDRAGNVYFTDQPNDRIVKWTAEDGKFSDWLKPAGRSNGMFFDGAGNLIACADEKNELWSISPDKKATVLLGEFKGKLLNGPNDLWIRPDGNLYFTDPRYPRPYWKRDPASQQAGEHVYFFDIKTRQATPVATDLKQPNGIIGTPDGKTLYVADIRDRKTYAYDVTAGGALENKRLFCELGSDGMTLDSEGNVYLTGQGVTVFDKGGKKIVNIPIPEPWTANVTFGGADRRQLFITASKKVYGLKMRVKGAY